MAEIKTRLKADLTKAMRAKDEFAKSTIRMLLAAITVEEVAGETARELSTAEEVAVVTKEQRKRRDAAQTYAAAGRQELADKENAEAELMAAYLPAPLTPAELDELVALEVAKLPERSPKQMGAVMKALSAATAGRADGADLAARVKAALLG